MEVLMSGEETDEGAGTLSLSLLSFHALAHTLVSTCPSWSNTCASFPVCSSQFFLFSPSFLLLSVHIRLSLASSTLEKRTVRSVRKERLDQPPGQPRTRPCLPRLTDVHFSQSQEALCRPKAAIGEKTSGRSPLMKRVCSGYQSYLVPMFHKLSHELFHWKTGSFSFYFFLLPGLGEGG